MEGIRINKYIANSGITSRRKADELILNGNVKVNGITIREVGIKVQPDDKVSVNGKLIEEKKEFSYYILNKPRGYITSLKDEQDRPTITDLTMDTGKRLLPVGRLDLESEGLLIMTDDNELINQLTNPKFHIEKTYLVTVNGNVKNKELDELRNGIRLKGVKLRKAKIEILEAIKGTTQLKVVISEGKNRQIRKMFKHIGKNVIQLKRIQQGELILGKLKEGHLRKLRPSEINYLKSLSSR